MKLFLLITSFTILLYYYQLSQSFFIIINNFPLSQSFFIIINDFPLSQSFFIIINNFPLSQIFTILLNYCYLYENKPNYEFRHLIHIFYHQNIMIFCQFYNFICSKFMLFSLNSFYFMSNNFFIQQNIFKFIKFSCNIYSFCCIMFFTINFFIEYIFDFNPTNSVIITPPNSSFILPITFLLVSLKTLNLLNSY